jgi:hypothetical protein
MLKLRITFVGRGVAGGVEVDTHFVASNHTVIIIGALGDVPDAGEYPTSPVPEVQLNCPVATISFALAAACPTTFPVARLVVAITKPVVSREAATVTPAIVRAVRDNLILNIKGLLRFRNDYRVNA